MKKIICLILFTPFLIYAGTTGKLAGTIKDAATGEPLIGANVMIEGTSFGAASNTEGEYVILNISPGRYSVRYSFIGSETLLIQNVTITVDQTTLINIELNFI